jgi:cell division protein FtsB
MNNKMELMIILELIVFVIIINFIYGHIRGKYIKPKCKEKLGEKVYKLRKENKELKNELSKLKKE